MMAFGAVIIWGSLVVLNMKLIHVPAMMVGGISLTFAGIISCFNLKTWNLPWRTLLVGVSGVFSYNLLYYLAFRYAPAVEANLLNYLWPLLIVVMTPLFIKEMKLSLNHIIGALLGFIGAALIVTGGHLNIEIKSLSGYLIAIGAAFCWAIYSLKIKKLPPFPSEAVSVFCFISGILMLVIYFTSIGNISEITRLTITDWTLLLILGIVTNGISYILWNKAMKLGDPRVIGSIAYLTPLLSTFALAIFFGKQITLVSGIAMIMIITGAIVGSLQKTYKD